MFAVDMGWDRWGVVANNSKRNKTFQRNHKTRLQSANSVVTMSWAKKHLGSQPRFIGGLRLFQTGKPHQHFVLFAMYPVAFRCPRNQSCKCCACGIPFGFRESSGKARAGLCAPGVVC